MHNNGTRDNLGYFRFLQASGAWCKKKGNMVELEIGAKLKIVPCTCLTMWPMDVLTVKPSTPSKRAIYNSSWNLEPQPGTNITVLVYGEFENLLEIDRTEPCCITFTNT